MGKLEAIDRAIVTLINSWHTPVLDELMWLISGKLTWAPLYVLLIVMFARKTNAKSTVFFVLFAILTVALTDQISVHLFKEFFQRYRPSHHALLTDTLHFYTIGENDLYKGGMYGFVSSHAANFFGVAGFAYWSLRKWHPNMWWWLLLIGALINYSRIYLGVHYLSDVFVGTLLGLLISYLVYRFIYRYFRDKFNWNS